MRYDPLEMPAICPVCKGALYIDVTDDSTDDDRVECAHCGRLIRIGDAIDKYNRINRTNLDYRPANHSLGGGKMSLMKMLDPETESIALEIVSGKEDVTNSVFQTDTRIYFNEGFPGIVWFDYGHKKEYEVLDYEWSGPRYQDVMIQSNDSFTHTKGGRKGRVAGAIIGTVLMPGLGTIIGAAVGTGKKEVSNTKGSTVSHIETQEVPVIAHMRLRDLDRDQIVNIGFKCTSALDARIRNNITVNLEPGAYIDFDEPQLLPESEKEPETKDVLSQLRELKALLDDGAISQEEYEILKKKII